MRLDFTIADSTLPDVMAKIKALAERLSERPELIDEIDFSDDVAIQAIFTPKVIAALEADDAEMEGGDFLTEEQVRERLVQKATAWTQAHPN